MALRLVRLYQAEHSWPLYNYIIYKAEKSSVRLQFQWRPTIFLPADARIEAFFVPNLALII